jgi:hypothetical protein
VGNPQNLLLVQDYAEGFIEQRCEGRVQVSDRFLAFETPHKGIFQSTAERAGAVERQRRHEVILAPGMDFTQSGAHPWAFNLETTNRLAGFETV